ncbi:hypothetical protein Tco_0467558 [Tanacetum coccineum]
MKIKESLNVTFNETPPPSKTSPLVDDDLDEEEAIKVTVKKNLENNIEDETLKIDELVNIKESRNHPLENIIGNLNQRTLRSQAQNQSNFFCFISTIGPKNVNEALTIIPPRQLLVDLSSEEDDTITPSYITKSSSSSPPNAPSKTPSTKYTSSTFGTTSSSFESKPQSSPPSSNDTPSPQPSNPFLKDIMDVPPRPSNPILLQSYSSLDITLSLSSITPLDHIFDSP